jgi:DNA-binding response OmpR family regulator
MRPMNILLIEDEPLIALELKLELEQAGHSVMGAVDADTAILSSGRNMPDIAIINFLYVNTIDGMVLAHLLRTRYLVKVLFITGANWKDLEDSAFFYAGHEVLYKPFTKSQFQAALNAVMQEIAKSKPI